jgi:hypothetical protein
MTYDIKEHAILMVMELYHITREETLELYKDEIDAAMKFVVLTSEFTDIPDHPLKGMAKQ